MPIIIRAATEETGGVFLASRRMGKFSGKGKKPKDFIPFRFHIP